MKEIEYSVGFLFAYSPRKGTPADAMERRYSRRGQTGKAAAASSAAGRDLHQSKGRAFLGQTVEVLVEKRNFKDNQFLKGKTRCWKNVLFAGGDELIGTMQQVLVHSYSHQTLLGELLPTSCAKSA